MAEAPEAHDPGHTPDQVESQIQFHADQLAKTTGWPAISRAAVALDADALRRQLAAGVAVDLKCSYAFPATPLQLVFGYINETIVYQREGMAGFLNLVTKPAQRRREIDEGISADRVACVELLLAHGASPNPDGEGSPPPLFFAASKGVLAAVKMLLAAGSEANVLYHFDQNQPNRVFSALHMLILENNPDDAAIADVLLKAGADANPPEFDGRTLMEWAIYGGHRELWPLLLRGGAILPTRESPFNGDRYDSHRAHPYLRKVDAAGSWTAHEKAHRATLQATFTPKFTHLVPPELVARIVEYSFHLGFY